MCEGFKGNRFLKWINEIFLFLRILQINNTLFEKVLLRKLRKERVQIYIMAIHVNTILKRILRISSFHHIITNNILNSFT